MAKAKKNVVPWGELGAAAVGATLGGVLGMLFSPNSGKKNREVVVSKGKKLARSAGSSLKKAENAVIKTEKKVAKRVVKAAASTKKAAIATGKRITHRRVSV